ncbi:MAG: pyruvate kinase [Angelakisella sp.]
MRKTKIICTLGPASTDKKIIRSMLEAGMNVARFNFSHGSYEEHLGKLITIRELRTELNRPVATLLDTKGPEIRLRKFEGGRTELVAGSTFTLTTREVLGDATQVAVTYQNLPHDVAKGTRILLDDGLIELRVLEVKNNTDVVCTVLNNGKISDRKGVNLPGTRISMPYLSETDRNDILFGIEQGFDFVAASFARSAQDIMDIRQVLTQHGGRSIKIIAKIENAEGVANIDQILKTADGIMVARGDLGVEIDLQEIPILQKMLIRKCYQSGKMVITATQMLESMSTNPRPTRAEASDVANAIYDGTSAIMLSGETAAGSYPVEAVKTMATIAERVENDIDYRKRFRNREDEASPSITDAISHATCTTAHDLHAAAIIPVSKSGRTARMISKYRPAVPIIACTSNECTYRQLSLSWGVTPIMMDEVDNTDDLLEQAIQAALENSHLLHDGDLVVLTAGIPVGMSGTTNLLKVQTVGCPLVSGTGLNTLSTVGNVCVAHNNEELFANFNFGDILVCNDTCDLWMKLVAHAAGVIVEQGANSHIATVADQLGIPVIFAAEGCCHVLQSGMTVVMDAKSGVVSPIAAEQTSVKFPERK